MKAVNQVVAISYVGYRELHAYEMCLHNSQSVCFIKNNFYSNTYNPGWRNHPNFSQGGNHNQSEQHDTQLTNRGGSLGFHQGQQRQHQLQGQTHQTSSSLSPLEALLKEYMQKNDALLQKQASSIRNLELQMGQIVGELKNRQIGSLPSNTKAPRYVGNSK